MKLTELIYKIIDIAKAQPNIGYAYEGSVYTLNELQDINYGAICITQTQHTETDGIINYGFNIFYVDRLTDNKANKLEVQSIGIETLSNICAVLCDTFGVDILSKTFHPFTERFDSECAGVYMEINVINAVGNYCGEDYE